MNLYQKIIEVRKIANGFSKDKEGFGFEYVSGNQILNKIKDKMNDVGLILQPSAKVGEHQIFKYTNSKGKEKTDIQVWGVMSYTWINAENPEEREVVEWTYYGQQDDISKAFGSGLTYSERYFLLKYFGLPTDSDDPDAKGGKQKLYKQPVIVTDEQIQEIFTLGKKLGYEAGKVLKDIENCYKITDPTELQLGQYKAIITGYNKILQTKKGN